METEALDAKARECHISSSGQKHQQQRGALYMAQAEVRSKEEDQRKARAGSY